MTAVQAIAAFNDARRKFAAWLEQNPFRRSLLTDMPDVTITMREYAELTTKAAWADHLDKNGLSEWDRFDEVTLRFRAGD